jgi:RNA polymerase primary sigma factor
VAEPALNGRTRSEPSGSRDILGAYLAEAGRHRLLTRSEEVRLARRIATGDRQARDALVLANLRLVVALARRYWLPPGSPLSLMDLVQEGTLGLIRAAELFDWRLGTRFSTYASFWIRQSVARSLAASGVIRLPVAAHRQLRAIARVEHQLKGRLGREPTDEEIAAAVPIPQLELAAIRIRTSVLSLDRRNEEGGTLADIVASPTEPSSDVERELTARALRGHVSELPERLREIIILHYGLAGDPPMSLARIGRRLGLSRERVRQLEGRALTELLRRTTPRPSPHRATDRLRALDPLVWLTAIKAGLAGSAASTVTTGLIATATITSIPSWHTPVPNATPQKQPTPLRMNADRTPSNANLPPSSTHTSETTTSDPSESRLAASERQDNNPTTKAKPRAAVHPATTQLADPNRDLPDSVTGTPTSPTQVSDSHEDLTAQLPAPQQQPTANEADPNDSLSPSSEAAGAPPAADRDPGQRTGPHLHAGTLNDNGQGAGPPPHAGPPADDGQGGGPPAHAGPPADDGQGGGPPAHAGPPADDGQGGGPPAQDGGPSDQGLTEVPTDAA